jgi:sulfite reductase (NADPH) flavoprotein alpha-component
VDFDKIKDTPQKKLEDFPIFKNTSLSEVKSIEFPFSEDPEDYFTIKLKDREIAVNQITGEILAEQAYPFTQIMSTLSLDLHTGRASIILAIILAIASGNILFFIYTGFAITFKRLSGKSKNQFTAEESRFVILVGSENGSTWDFANGFYQQLIKLGEKTYISTLNEYQSYPSAEHLVVFTSTYGAGDAPNSATNFKNYYRKYFSTFKIFTFRFSVLVRVLILISVNLLTKYITLSSKSWAKPLLDVHTVNDKSEEDYALWAEAWSTKTGISISSKAPLKQPNNFRNLEVVSNTSNQHDDTFLIKFKTKRWTKVKSGDLLAIYPANDHRERLYSIGVVDKSDIQLSVRLHENGLGSGFLHRLKAGDTFKAKIVQNSHFHFPKNSPEVIMICNGTGIGPFLGMLSQNNKQIPCHLYAGLEINLA